MCPRTDVVGPKRFFLGIDDSLYYHYYFFFFGIDRPPEAETLDSSSILPPRQRSRPVQVTTGNKNKQKHHQPTSTVKQPPPYSFFFFFPSRYRCIHFNFCIPKPSLLLFPFPSRSNFVSRANVGAVFFRCALHFFLSLFSSRATMSLMQKPCHPDCLTSLSA